MAWHDALENDVRGYVANKGWDKLDGETAARSILQSYRNLESTRPAPPVVPKAPTEYTFDGVVGKDGKAPPDTLLGQVRDMAFDLKLPVEGAKALAVKMLGTQETAALAAEAAKVERMTVATGALKTAWGEDFETKNAVAQNAFEALKLSKEMVDHLIDSMGVDKVMQFGHDLGTRMGEAPLLRGEGGMGNTETTLTREQALVERNRLVNDPEFGKKVASGDREALAQMDKVTRAIITTPNAPGGFTPAPRNFGRTYDNPTGAPVV